MDTKDITERQFKTLLLLLKLQEYLKENPEYKTLANTVAMYAEGEGQYKNNTDFEITEFIKDVYELNNKGYIVATVSLDTNPIKVPYVERITTDGLKALADYVGIAINYEKGSLSREELAEKIEAFLNSSGYQIIFGIVIPIASIVLQIVSMIG